MKLPTVSLDTQLTPGMLLATPSRSSGMQDELSPIAQLETSLGTRGIERPGFSKGAMLNANLNAILGESPRGSTEPSSRRVGNLEFNSIAITEEFLMRIKSIQQESTDRLEYYCHELIGLSCP